MEFRRLGPSIPAPGSLVVFRISSHRIRRAPRRFRSPLTLPETTVYLRTSHLCKRGLKKTHRPLVRMMETLCNVMRPPVIDVDINNIYCCSRRLSHRFELLLSPPTTTERPPPPRPEPHVDTIDAFLGFISPT